MAVMRANRLITLLSMLESGRTVAGAELAGRLGVTERTLRRDVAALREEGYVIAASTGIDGGYTLMRGSRLPPLLFDEEQVLALAIALQATPVIAGVNDGAERALTTVRQILPARLAGVLDRYTLEISRLGAPTVDPAVMAALAASIRRREVLTFMYSRPGTTAPERRRMEPHHVVHHQAHFYLVGWDLERADWRVFRADRLVLLGMPGARFERRELPEDAAEYVRRRVEGRDWPCTGIVVLHAPLAFVARWADPDWTLTEVDDEHVRVEATAWTWRALVAWLAQFDVPFDIEGPGELRRAAAELAERLADTALRTNRG